MKRTMTVILSILCILILAACSSDQKELIADDIEKALTDQGYHVSQTDTILLSDGEKEAAHLMADKNSEFLDICFSVEEKLNDQIYQYYTSYYPEGVVRQDKDAKLVYYATSEQVLSDAGISFSKE